MSQELEASVDSLAMCNLTFDDSGNLLVYGSLRGIKVSLGHSPLSSPSPCYDESRVIDIVIKCYGFRL